MGIAQGITLESEKYHVIRELGRGGMGVVYLAEDRLLKRQVALKVLYEHLNREHTFVERFQEEARSVSTLHHPHIVCVHGLERTGEQIAIDMEFVPGQSLDRYRQVSELTTHIVAGIAGDVFSGLATCHAIGVVHRDIKPSNILVTEDSRAKITDFGLATAYASHLEATIRGNTSSGFYMGTPRYMPLQAWEGGHPKPYWDLYAFGVVLFELLSGRVAFEGDNPMAIMRKQLAEPLPPLDSIAAGVSSKMSELVQALLAPDEDSSITAVEAQEMLQQTPEYQDLHDSNAASTVSLPKPPIPRKRHKYKRFSASRIRWGLAGAGVVVIVGVSVWVANREASAPPPADTPKASLAAPETGANASAPFSSTGEPVYLDVRAVDDADFGAGTWMVERDPQGAPRRMRGFTSLGLWDLYIQETGNPREEGWRVTGNWAAMLSTQSQIAHFGNLEGTLAWDQGSGSMILSLVRIRERDRHEVKFSAYGRMKSEAYDASKFFHDLEANTILQTLIYGELLGRSQEWVIDLENQLPALRGGRIKVPHLSEPITADGILSESTWTRGAFDSTGRIGEANMAEGSPNAPLLLRWTDDAVFVGLKAGVSGAAPVLELGVLPALESSLEHTGRFFVQVDANGTTTGRYKIGRVEQPWTCNWESGVTFENGVFSVELRIPLADLEERARPSDQKRWRTSARLTNEDPSGNRVLRARWGDTEYEALQHGMLLIFRGSAP